MYTAYMMGYMWLSSKQCIRYQVKQGILPSYLLNKICNIYGMFCLIKLFSILSEIYKADIFRVIEIPKNATINTSAHK